MNDALPKPGAANAPSHIAYQVRDREEGAGIFNRIGAAWPNKDGKGFTILLDCLPIDGRITLRQLEEKSN